MLFKKSFTDIDFQDIQKLYDDKIEESEILDYKEREIEDEKILKEVAAFSNTRGGFLIYGIKESGSGGYPIEINGIAKTFGTERLEQIIISNIMPRISVRIKKIDIPNSENIVVVVNIPEAQNRPYYNNRSKKFHKRYNFEAKEMDEHEIEALYLERFFGVGNLSKYVDETILFNRSLIPTESRFFMDAHIIITPLRINERIMNSSNVHQVNFPTETNFESIKSGQYIYGSSSPSKYGIRWKNAYRNWSLEIHRNGLVHYMEQYGSIHAGRKIISDIELSSDFLKTIKFASLVYSNLNFNGKVKILLKIFDSKDSVIPLTFHPSRDSEKCLAKEILIEREWDSWKLEEDCSAIGKSVLDELMNHYGLEKSTYFYEENSEIKFKKSR
jgi:hypothetical protein